ncbi:RNA polymerase sigma factor [Candidatus Peribacteria bacterium]|nr:RNA polymerase sigma factor [Candidatus Peribacteria bacterium]MBT4240826.1 RNA polymerase sigma factor [Candidatus Peribacteria bacterium]MBT4474145.1 RNA polymerase sigma factor [Candidatus Peribacteria bacterium]
MESPDKRVNGDKDLELIDLVDRAKSGDEDAFTNLYTRYYPLVRSSLFRFGSANYSYINDLVQDTFARAFICIDQLKEGEMFASWILQITRRISINFHRDRIGQQFRREEDIGVRDFIGSNRNSSEADSACVTDDRDRKVIDAFEQLRDLDRQSIDLFYFRDMSIEEIASDTGCIPQTVKTRLYRARRRMREELKKVGINEANFQVLMSGKYQ